MGGLPGQICDLQLIERFLDANLKVLKQEITRLSSSGGGRVKRKDVEPHVLWSRRSQAGNEPVFDLEGSVYWEIATFDVLVKSNVVLGRKGST